MLANQNRHRDTVCSAHQLIELEQDLLVNLLNFDLISIMVAQERAFCTITPFPSHNYQYHEYPDTKGVSKSSKSPRPLQSFNKKHPKILPTETLSLEISEISRYEQ